MDKNIGYVSEETFKYALDAQREHYATIIKRLLVVFTIIILLMIAGVVYVVIYFLNNFEMDAVEYSQDGQGVNIIGDSNGVDYDNGTEAQNNESSDEEQEESQR
jgi:hypothetical protein